LLFNSVKYQTRELSPNVCQDLSPPYFTLQGEAM